MYRRAAVCSSVGGKEGGEMIGGYKKKESASRGFSDCVQRLWVADLLSRTRLGRAKPGHTQG